MISPGELTALVIAVTGLIAALAGLYGQMRSLSRRVDGRLTELLALTRKSARAEGALDAGMPAQAAAAGMPEFDAADHAQTRAGPTQDP